MLVLPVLEPVPGPPALVPGETSERELGGGEAQTFRVAVPPGQPLLITAEQRGLDVVLAVQDPSGKPLGTMDSAIEREGTETWLIAAGAGGPHRIGVRPAKAFAPRGRYRIGVEVLASAAPEDLWRVEAERLMTAAGLLFTQSTVDAQQQARALYEQALAHWRALERKPEEARALFLLAVVHQRLSQFQPMLDRLQAALPLFAALGDRAREADVLTYRGLGLWKLGRYGKAIAAVERSLEIRRARNDRWGEAVTSQNLCLIRVHLSEWREAIRCYEQLLPLLEEVGEPDAEAFNGLGGAYSGLGELRKARELYDRSLQKRRALNDWKAAAVVLNNLAVLSVAQDDLGQALDYYGQSLEAVRKVGDREWVARILSNLAGAYLDLGEPQRALDLLNEALPVRHELGDKRGEVATLLLLGSAHERLGDEAAALAPYGQALQIAREMEDRAWTAFALAQSGRGYLQAGDPARALELLTQAADLHRALENRAGLAAVLQLTGEAETRLKQPEKALATLREALGLWHDLGDPSGKVETLSSLAAAERGLGRLQEAVAHAEEAVSLVESSRTKVADPGLRASLLASRRRAFDLAIGLRMDLGDAEAALALSERARARSLLDLLQEARNKIRDGMSPELREREENLAFQLGRNARDLRGSPAGEKRAQLQRERAELLAGADRLEDQIRRSNPRYAALDQPPLDAAAIRALLDPGTVLLEFTLGEERSFLWLVTPERVESFELPGREEIEAVAHRTYIDASKLEEGDAAAHQALSRLLFGKVAADRLHVRRLVIVADGALQYVPFAILPDPEAPGVPLVVGHEIVSLPSASVLDTQRRVLAGRPRARKAVAILANPVFSLSDSRLPKPAPSRTPARAPAAGERFQRLPATEREARAIAGLLPPDQVFLGLGTEASRATALGGSLAGYRAVHFATHGQIDPETPRLSFLALSMFDDKAQPQEGYLRLSDVYNLKLDADLVVLSGCETALGREIRGEGLMGLTQGFFYAGAERVMASLWRVEDSATAELMSRFYRGMLKEGLPPAAALRAAQLAVRSDPRWQDPFYWAPFVLQGDWR
jgi:CHAT domain-containing protein/tetratricopeptide (TPR) repeat protein